MGWGYNRLKKGFTRKRSRDKLSVIYKNLPNFFPLVLVDS